MTDEMIKDLANAFSGQHNFINQFVCDTSERELRLQAWKAQLRDDVVSVANVIHKHRPQYPMRRFYEMAGYEGAHPHHA